MIKDVCEVSINIRKLRYSRLIDFSGTICSPRLHSRAADRVVVVDLSIRSYGIFASIGGISMQLHGTVASVVVVVTATLVAICCEIEGLAGVRWWLNINKSPLNDLDCRGVGTRKDQSSIGGRESYMYDCCVDFSKCGSLDDRSDSCGSDGRRDS